MKLYRSILLVPTVATLLLASQAAPAQSTLGAPIVYNGDDTYLSLFWNPIDGFTTQTGIESGVYFIVGNAGGSPFPPPTPAQIASETGSLNGLSTAGEAAYGTVLEGGWQFSNHTYYNPNNNETASYFGMDYDLGGGNYNLGWVEYSTSADGATITLLDAYMNTTPNDPVTVGVGIVPTPEPSTTALVAIGGIGGLMMIRRRK